MAEILRLCRRPMVLPGPLVRSMLRDLLGAVALCHDRNVVIKSLDAEKVRISRASRGKRGGEAEAEADPSCLRRGAILLSPVSLELPAAPVGIG